jgi:hypothetical protein
LGVGDDNQRGKTVVVKSIAIAGTVIGWGSAAGLIFIDTITQAHVLAQALMLGVGIVSTAWLMLCCRNRPMSAAFELGYEMGRRDALRERNEPRRVAPIRDYLEQREREAFNG